MDAICPHMLPRSQCIHCLRAVVARGLMTPRTRDVLEMAIESGVLSGIRHGWKHCDDAWPTREQQDAITNAVMTSVDEWFVFEETQ